MAVYAWPRRLAIAAAGSLLCASRRARVLDRIGLGEAVLDADVAFGLVGDERGSASADNQLASGQRRGGKAGRSERSRFG
jgi:hypothetical protein